MEFSVLGEIEVVGETGVVPLGGVLQRRLMARLVLDVGHVVSIDRLVDSVWLGDPPSEKADRVVRSYVSRLRRALQPDAASDQLRELIVAKSPGYVLDVDPQAVDAVQLERLRAAGDQRRRNGDAASALERFDEALALWRGPAYSGFDDEPWATVECQRLEELRLATIEQRFGCLLDLGRHADAVADLEAVAVEHPTREHLWELWMLALYRSGRQQAALDAYQRLRGTLADEFGLEPAPRLRELEQDILQQDQALDAPDQAAAQTGQLSVPAARTSLLGREVELEAGRQMIVDAPIVTITGVGGVGKTRLALELAARASSDGSSIAWTELAPISGRADILAVLAAAMGLRVVPGGDVLSSIVGGLNHQRLIVLDNAEHVLDDVAGIVDDIVSAAPLTTFLVTSREPLGVAGEAVLPLRPLSLEVDGEGDASPATQLFVERAGQIGIDLDVADRHVAELCRRLDGIPLAIELAAGLTPTLSAAEIGAALNQRFEILVGSRRRADRHRTLRETLAWSHDLLDDDAKTLLAQLSVFAGAFELDDVLLLTDSSPSQIIPVLHDLVAKSLVVSDTDHARTRYHLLETVREYASEQLEAIDSAEAWRQRHLRTFVHLALTIGALSREGAEERAVERAHGALDNLREAFHWAQLRADAEACLTLATELFDVAKWSGVYEVLDWAEQALAVPGSEAFARAGTAKAITAEAAVMRNDLELAEALGHEALRAQPPAHRPSLTMFALSGAALFTGDVDLARERSISSLEHAKRDGFVNDAVFATVNIAFLDWMQHADADGFPEARAMAVEANSMVGLIHMDLYQSLVTSTHVGALADLGPAIEAARRCRYRVVELRIRRAAAFNATRMGGDLEWAALELRDLLDEWGVVDEAVELVHVVRFLAEVLLVANRSLEEAVKIVSFVEATIGPFPDMTPVSELGGIVDLEPRLVGNAIEAGRAMTLTEAVALAREVATPGAMS